MGPHGVTARNPPAAVSAQIHQPAATADIFLHGSTHRAREIFRVRSEHDHAIGSKESETFGIEVLIGRDVVYEPFAVKPVNQVHVGQNDGRRHSSRLCSPAAV